IIPELIIPAELIDELIVGEVQPLPIARPLTIPELITAAAWRYGVDPGYMVRLAHCESGLRPWAVSPWGDRGLFQWQAASWREAAPKAGITADWSAAFDPQSASLVTAAAIARGERWRWPWCGR
ncbi:MAG TPA: transglycosylase SLT domain-containing protein, partial [Chloroflexota bacterium]|nr:transglycosylase SLT domain-containing protein [Chloroflexota bacterium]